MGMEFRPYYLAKEWIKQGHNVRIIAGEFSHLRKNNPTVKQNLEIQEIEGIEYQWIKSGVYQGNGVKRAVSMAKFCKCLYTHAGAIVKDFKPDVVIASSTYPLDAYPARHIANKAKCKYIHEVHDMWPITPIELYGMSKKHPFVVVMQAGENYFCKKADKVVSILPAAKDYFVEHGMKSENFAVVTNGIVLDDWNQSKPLNEKVASVLKQKKAEGKKIISFFGSHTRSYSLDYLIKAVKKLDRNDVFLAFVGNGNYREELEKLAEKISLDRELYEFFGLIGKDEIPSLIELSDASYVAAIKNDMFRFGIAMNKLFDAMMGGKPIIYAVEAPNNYIKEYDCGISVEAENVDALANGIEVFLQLSEEEKIKMGQNAQKAVLENFNYEKLAQKFENIMCE